MDRVTELSFQAHARRHDSAAAVADPLFRRARPGGLAARSTRMRQGRGAPGAGLVLRRGSVCTNNHQAAPRVHRRGHFLEGGRPYCVLSIGICLGKLARV